MVTGLEEITVGALPLNSALSGLRYLSTRVGCGQSGWEWGKRQFEESRGWSLDVHVCKAGPVTKSCSSLTKTDAKITR